MLVHLDHLGRGDHRQHQAGGIVFGQLRTDQVRPPDQADLHAEFLAGGDGGFDIRLGAEVAAHRIENDLQRCLLQLRSRRGLPSRAPGRYPRGVGFDAGGQFINTE